jgi:hypothetical protein
MYASQMASGGITYTPSFMTTGIGLQAVLRSNLINLRDCIVGVTDGRD